MAEYEKFNLGDFPLQSGKVLHNAHIAFKTYGSLAADKSNVILYPTSYGAQHFDTEWLIGKNSILDPSRYFIIIPNMFTNGLSSSPSLMPPGEVQSYPNTTILDNVMAQRRLLVEVFGIEKIALCYGWSMGGQQAYHWATHFPELVERLCVVCSSARTSPHNLVFIDGVKSGLTADAAYQDGWFKERPHRGFRAMARIYAGWAQSQAFYREELWRDMGFTSIEDFLKRSWEDSYTNRDANDLLAQFWTWEKSDISDNTRFKRDFKSALGAISAKTLVMPSETDLYFRVEDNRREVIHMPNAQLRPIQSIWGHRAGNPRFNRTDERYLAQAVAELLQS